MTIKIDPSIKNRKPELEAAIQEFINKLCALGCYTLTTRFYWEDGTVLSLLLRKMPSENAAELFESVQPEDFTHGGNT